MSGFHAQDGWFFERNAVTGSVTVRKYKEATEGSQLVIEVVFAADTWASICAAVSSLGATAATYGVFRALQRGF